MKLSNFQSINQRGVLHHVIPLVAFVGLFAIAGGYFLLTGQAATGYQLQVGLNRNFCMDDYQASTASKAPIIMYKCSTTDQAAQWTEQYISGTTRFIIKSNRGPCVDAIGDSANAYLQTYSCNQADKAQVFYWNTNSRELVNYYNHACITDMGGLTTGFSSRLQMGSCTGSPDEAWYYTTPSNGVSTGGGVLPSNAVGEVTSGLSGRCLDDYQNSSSSGNKVTIWNCSSSDPAEKWSIANSTGNASIHKIFIYNMCMTVQNGGTANGDKIVLTTCGTSPTQYWYSTSNGLLHDLGTQGTGSGFCLADPSAGPNGTQLQVSPCNVVSQQVWHVPQP